MPSQTPTLKRHNHRVHPCKDEKKEELLELLLSQNTDKKIFVVSSTKTELTSTQENVTIVSDEELAKMTDAKCDMMISFNLPSKASKYMQRITHTNTYALILVNPSEEKVIHPIETLIGRTIMQELIEGFSEVQEQKQAQPSLKSLNPTEAREERKREFLGHPKEEKKPREDREQKSYDDKPRSDKAHSDKKPWEKKERKENKFLGKDEKGKAMFSGKSGERNHHYDGTPKNKAPKLTGKKISIKGAKKKD